MKKVKIHSNDTHFIGCWNLENDNLCNKIIEFFESNKNLQIQGASAAGVNIKIKKTIDIGIKPNDLKKEKFEVFKQYIGGLHKCFFDYQNQWPFLKQMIKNVYIPAFNIQRYEKGDHFALLHSERGNLSTSHRLFAWMTYLNNVDEGGQTNFSHYGIKIKPETGKTLIWPAEWTHAHTGEILKDGKKYIVTGWMHFPIPD